MDKQLHKKSLNKYGKENIENIFFAAIILIAGYGVYNIGR